MSDLTFKMTVATNVGLVRSNNEDNFIVTPDLSKPDNWFAPSGTDEVIALGEHGCVMVVADGMGGMNAGEVASELAVNSIRESFTQVKDFSAISDCSNHVEAFLKKVITTADAQIKKKVKEDPSTSGMGTTVVLVWVVGNVAHVAWCGDSRAYLFNRNSGLSRLSNDHSYVQELVDTGKLDPELAFDHPNSNIITRSLGDSPAKAQPDYVCKGISAGDYLILCTDGLCGLVRDEEILDVMMKEHTSIEEYKNALFNAALEAGGYDNITISLFECMSVKEEELTSTVSPLQATRKNKPGRDTEKTADRNGFRLALKILIAIILVLTLIAVAGYFLGVISIDGNSITFDLNNLKTISL